MSLRDANVRLVVLVTDRSDLDVTLADEANNGLASNAVYLRVITHIYTVDSCRSEEICIEAELKVEVGGIIMMLVSAQGQTP